VIASPTGPQVVDVDIQLTAHVPEALHEISRIA